jgi:hypothetical protein
LGFLSIAISGIINAYIKIKIVKKNTKSKAYLDASLLADIIFILTIILSGYILTPARNFSLLQMIEYIYGMNSLFNNALTVIYPAIFFSIVITNIFLIFKRIKVILNKDLSKYKPTTFKQILATFIASSFIGLFYLNELDLSFVTDMDSVTEARNLFLVIITAVFLPTFFSILQDEKQKKICVIKDDNSPILLEENNGNQ